MNVAITSIRFGCFSNKPAKHRVPFSLGWDTALVIAPDDTGRIINLDGQTYTLSREACQMLRETLAHGPADASRIIAKRYGIELARSKADLENLLAELGHLGFINTGTNMERRDRLGARLSESLLSASLKAVHRMPSLRMRIWMLLALARTALRLFGWRASIRAWLDAQPHNRKPIRPDDSSVRDEIALALRRAVAGYVFGVDCKEKAMCCWALMRATGQPATLVLGVSLYPLGSHFWCESSGHILTDFADRCEDFIELLQLPSPEAW